MPCVDRRCGGQAANCGGGGVEIYKFPGWSDLNTLDYATAKFYRDKKGAGPFRTATIKTIGINQLLAQLPPVNFLNIDIEGLDDEVVAAIDLAQYPIDAILYEDNVNWQGSDKIQKKMRAHGYTLLFISGGSICYVKQATN